MQAKKLPKITAVVGIIALIFFQAQAVFAQNDAEIRDQIDDRNDQIEELEEEINQYQGELENTQAQAQTLEEAVALYDQSIQRISNDVADTANKINVTQQDIASIESSISETEGDMETNKSAIAKTVQALARVNNQTFVEVLLSAESLSEVWNYSAQLENVQQQANRQLQQLRQAKERLTKQKEKEQQRRTELASLQEEQAAQRSIVQSQQAEKEELLSETNQQASEYQTLIAQKQEQKERFEAQLREFESQLGSSSDGGFAESGQLFGWPVQPVVITQQFGGTEFAKRNPAAYGRPFHNGTDFGVPVGTPIKSVTDGTVRATGNTDAVAGCYSYGKWVLVDHPNGLSTLYAHLSRRGVSAGQSVAAGEQIGYSGNTGYSTGPHLHLTTYIQDDVQIRDLGDVKQSTNCGGARMPVAPLDSYINSMNYLPQ